TLASDSTSRLLRDLERIWERPKPELLKSLVGRIKDDRPLVRLAACEALGRVGDEKAIDPLVARLGDESKAARRAAAEALRSIGNRFSADRNPGETDAQARLVTALDDALRSRDDRMRQGATRVFAAHFRDLSQELPLANALLARLDDTDPVVAMQ